MADLAELSSLSFVAPPWDAPLDVDGAIARCPADAVMKGVMSAALVDAVARVHRRIPGAQERYLPFQHYPLREHMALMRDAGAILWPRDPARIHFRRFGRAVRATLLEQPYGRVALGKGGMEPTEVVQRLARAYRVILGFEVTPHVAPSVDGAVTLYVEMKDIWYFLDSCHVGVFEGVLLDPSVKAARTPEFRIHLRDEHNGVLRIEC